MLTVLYSYSVQFVSAQNSITARIDLYKRNFVIALLKMNRSTKHNGRNDVS